MFVIVWLYICLCFFFNDTATTEIYTLSLHDALPIFLFRENDPGDRLCLLARGAVEIDRKSTRLNSSHQKISYAVFCLKKIKWICLRWTDCRRTCELGMTAESGYGT